MKKLLIMLLMTSGLLGCQTTTKPVVGYATENVISYRYHAYDMMPTLPIEVRDMAQKHCAQFGKNAVYKGYKPVHLLTTEQDHSFICETQKVIVTNN